jgi:drug/metabolite transporter (DMT)-like permease
MSGYVKIIISVLIWSSWGILVRWLDLPALVISFFSTSIACLTLSFVWAFKFQRRKLKPQKTKNLFFFLALGILVALSNVLYFQAFRTTTIANATLSHYLAPILVFILAPIMIREKIEARGMVSLILSTFGLYLITWGPGLKLTSQDIAGIGFGAASALFYALQINAVRHLAPRFSALALTWYGNLGASLTIFPWIYSEIYLVHSSALPILLLMGIFCSGLAPIIYISGLKTVPAHHAGVLSYLEPVGGILLAFLFLSESPRIITLIGGAFIVGGGYYLIRLGRNRSSTIR